MRKINWLFFLNNKGETGGGAAGAAATEEGKEGSEEGKVGAAGGDAKFTQEDLNRILANERREFENKYKDYGDLKSKVEEFEKHKETAAERDLEAKKEYDKLKEGWATEKTKLTGIISEKDGIIKDLKIDHAIAFEMSKQNAYPEATVLIKEHITMGEDGTITVKGKDPTTKVDTQLNVEEGIKQFLKDKPYLVRSTGSGGAGTGAGGGSSSGGGDGSGTPEDLSVALAQARSRGDRDEVVKIKNQIRAKYGHVQLAS